MASENKLLQAKIASLQNRINDHRDDKASTASFPATLAHAGHYNSKITTQTSPTSSVNILSGPTARGWRGGLRASLTRGRARGGRSNIIHRNKTLVLNNSTSAEEIANPAGQASYSTQEEALATGLKSASWVTKTDRHLQLINPAIYEKQSQARAKAIEESRNKRLKQRDDKEKAKLSRHLQRIRADGVDDSLSHDRNLPPAIGAMNYEINVHGIRFRVAKNGAKLIKIPGEDNITKATPKTALVGGVKFYRSKNGNLYRSGVVRAQRRSGLIRKIDEVCKSFSTTGSCNKGPRCRYIHDPNKVAICRDFLVKDSCPAGDSCDLSHDISPERTPTCLHFTKGKCSNQACRYSHVHVSPNALVCRAFGLYGYCEKGADCLERHASECPDFSNTGVCGNKGCKLLHRHKASVIRRNAASISESKKRGGGGGGGGEGEEEDDASDISSSEEEEEEIDSDDVDSDEVDEQFFGGDDGPDDGDASMQQDFVHF